jgi:hypothetical protein
LIKKSNVEELEKEIHPSEKDCLNLFEIDLLLLLHAQ